jgi:deazaflavin-dependent oxidoreductase (nitroreductase family)
MTEMLSREVGNSGLQPTRRHLADGKPIGDLVNLQDRTVSARLYSDAELYELEMERIFARNWIAVAHETEIPNPGDYVTRYVGEDPVIVARDRTGGINVMLNSCSHGGMTVCRAEVGNTKYFRCPYHAWSYDATGTLVAVSAEKEMYDDTLDKSKLGLMRARTETFAGMVFANRSGTCESSPDTHERPWRPRASTWSSRAATPATSSRVLLRRLSAERSTVLVADLTASIIWPRSRPYWTSTRRTCGRSAGSHRPQVRPVSRQDGAHPRGRVPSRVVDDPRSRPMTPFQERVSRVAVQWMTGANIVTYLLSGGRAAGQVGGGSLCLLTTTGRRSGQSRTVPLLYVPDGENLVVVASRGGMSTHPGWYLNLQADPVASVRVGALQRPVRARDASEDERGRFWPRLAAAYPYFDAYRARTSRRIPMVILSPA